MKPVFGANLDPYILFGRVYEDVLDMFDIVDTILNSERGRLRNDLNVIVDYAESNVTCKLKLVDVGSQRVGNLKAARVFTV